MRKLSLFLAAVMLFGCLGLNAYAEQPAQARFTSYDQVNEAITVIPATDTQAELGYLAGVTEILTVDGLQFKDLNSNGALDKYEDWRLDVDERVKDLYNQMTLEEKAGLFYHVNTCGNPQGVDFADSRYMFSTETTVPDENATFVSKSMWYYINELQITSQLDNTNGTPRAAGGLSQRHAGPC